MMMLAAPAQQVVAFFIALFFFHTSEFLLALLFHGRRHVSSSSFLFSKQYLLAMLSGLLEYGVEVMWVPKLKTQPWVSYTGLALIICGEVIRKSAILTAEQNFTHDIKTHHHENHELVTHGIYRLVRHPSYLGFFIWSIGTQVLLCNPLCVVAYTVVTWRFFERRIQFEEYYLRHFFGKRYVEYAKRVPSGIPFVR